MYIISKYVKISVPKPFFVYPNAFIVFEWSSNGASIQVNQVFVSALLVKSVA